MQLQETLVHMLQNEEEATPEAVERLRELLAERRLAMQAVETAIQLASGA